MPRIVPAAKPRRNAPPAPQAPAPKAPAPQAAAPRRLGPPQRPQAPAPQAAAPIPQAPAPTSPGVVMRRPGAPAIMRGAAPPAPPVVDAEKEAIRSELAAVKGELAKLTAAAARSRTAAERSYDDIVTGGADLVAADDWRVPYQGQQIWIKAWDRKPGKNGNTNEPLVLTDSPPYVVLLAIPRDADGQWGTEARARGELAMHFRVNEAGNYTGEPVYIDANELATIWLGAPEEGEEEQEG